MSANDGVRAEICYQYAQFPFVLLLKHAYIRSVLSSSTLRFSGNYLKPTKSQTTADYPEKIVHTRN